MVTDFNITYLLLLVKKKRTIMLTEAVRKKKRKNYKKFILFLRKLCYTVYECTKGERCIMTPSLWTDLFREIKKSKSRFLSLLFIVMLGVAFFTGLRASEPDMNATIDAYFDQQQFMDIRVLSNYGMTEEDLQDIRMLKGVSFAKGEKTAEAICVLEDSEAIMKLISATDGVNDPYVVEGRVPGAVDECLIDVAMAKRLELEVGDELVFTSGKKDTDILDVVTQKTFRIVGIGSYPTYLNLNRGSGSLGDGQIDYYAVLFEDAFVTDVFTEIYVLVDDAEELDCDSKEYETLVQSIIDRIARIEAKACERRLEQVKELALDELHASDEFREAWEEAHEEANQVAVQEAYETAYQEAYDAAYDESLQAAKDEAYQMGLDAIRNQAREEAYDPAYEEAWEAAYEIAFKEAYAEALKAAKQEAHDIGLETAKKQAYETALHQVKSEAKQQAIDQAYAMAYEQGYQIFYEQAYEQGYQQMQQEVSVIVNSLAKMLTGDTSQEATLAVIRELLESNLGESELTEEILQKITEYLENNQSEENADALAQEMMEALEPTLKEYYDEQFEKEFSSGVYETLFQLQFDKTFKEEYQPQVEEAFEKTWQEQYQAEFDAGFEKEWKDTYQAQFETEFEKEWNNTYQAQFDTEFKQNFDEEFKKNFDAEFEAQFNETFDKEFDEKFEAEGREEYDAEFNKQWEETYQKEFDDAFQEEFKKNFDNEFYAEFDKLWESTYQKEFEEAFSKEFYTEFDREAMKEIEAELDPAEWYILDRSATQAYVEYTMDAERIGKIGKVFPLLFFLVAALVSLTTMTRMVEEQRSQIGTLKALGYSGGVICIKFFLYALLATVVGSVFGTLIGEKLFPWVIITAYGMMYTGIYAMALPYHWGIAIGATVLAIVCILGGCMAVCVRTAMGQPATLMRPPAPKAGKRIWLEYIKPLWKRMTFTQKASARNLFRYKKRMIMTVFGIGGCMGLLLVGFGVRDSILAIAKYQFGEIFVYDAGITLDMEAEEDDRRVLQDYVASYEGVMSQTLLHTEWIDAVLGDVTKNCTMFVPMDTEHIGNYFVMRDRLTGEGIAFPEKTGTVALSEKMATELGVEIGDTLQLKPDETSSYEVEVGCIYENYIQHYIFMTPETYEQVFEATPEYQTLWVRAEERDPKTGLGTVTGLSQSDFEDQFCTDMLLQEGCSTVALSSTTQGSIDDMLASLDLVVWVLILSAGLLAFIVLYNLNNINITERRRELATIKVLGFYDNEVASYVYRDSFALTAMGCVAGILMGKVMHYYVIITAEVELMMFGRNILLPSYAYSILLTLLFSIIVNQVMNRQLKKIDMVESLKSVE